MITPEEHREFISDAIEGNINKAETFLIIKLMKHFVRIKQSQRDSGSPGIDAGCNAISLADVIRELMEHEQVDVNVKRQLSGIVIVQAATFNLAHVIRELFRYHMVDVNCRRSLDQTPLIVASYCGHVEVVRELLKHDDVDVNASCRSDTALTTAAQCGNAEIVSDLLNDKRLKMNARDLKRMTGQVLAKRKGNPNHLQSPMVRELLQAKVFWASEHGYSEMIRESIKHEGFDWNLKTHRGRTPLIVASAWGQLKVVNELLKVQAVDVNAQDDDGRTPLIMASSVGHVKMVLALLKHRQLIVDAKDNTGRTALVWAGELGHVKVVRTLLAHSRVRNLSKVGKFAVNVDTGIGRTALMIAGDKGYAGIVGELLKQWRVDVNVVRGYNFNSFVSSRHGGHAKVVHLLPSRSLFMSSPHGRPDVVGELLKRTKAGVNTMTRRDRPSLTWANGKDHVRIFGEVLKFMKANAEGADGWTTLCLESDGGPVAVELVKQKAVDTSDKDDDDTSGLIHARGRGHLEAFCDFLKQEKVESGKGHLAVVRRSFKHEGVDLTFAD